MKSKKDIFISYKNDGEGNNFAARICSDLENLGYEVYYNPNEQHAGSFPERLKNAVEACKDFLLIVTQPCLDQLIRHDKIDWVREELLTAYRNNKNIVPLLMPGVSMPKDKEDMPEDLRFLSDKDAVSIADPYNRSPFEFLLSWVTSKPEKGDKYKNTYQSNDAYNINDDLQLLEEKAQTNDVNAIYVNNLRRTTVGYAFISYSTKNQASADAMRELFNKHNIDTWMAPYDIPAGSKYAAVITKAIRDCSCFVLLLSNDSQASEAVDSEVELATLTFKKSIIAVELEKVILNDAFTFYIHNKQIIAAHKIDEDSREIKQILEAVRAYTNATEEIDMNSSETIDIASNNRTIDNDTIENTEDCGEILEKEGTVVVEEISNLDEANVISNKIQESSKLDETNNGIARNDENGKQGSNTVENITLGTVLGESDATSKPKAKGHLVSSYRRAIVISKEDCVHPIEILMPDDTTKTFDFCDEFTVSNQKKYIVVRQMNDSDEYLFFIFRSRSGKNTLISEGQDQKKVYRWFREKHMDEYMFTDDKAVMRNERKKKHFAQDTAPRLFATTDDIPQILVLPDKYEHISANAFAKLNPNGKEIRQIIISDSVEVIDDNAFAGLVVTEAVHIPKSVKKTGHNAFTLKEGAYIYCEGNSYIHIWGHDSELIKDAPFKRTGPNKLSTVLSELSTSNGVTRIKSNTLPFSSIEEEIEELVIPDGICVIDKHALDNVKVKNRVVIPSSVTKIGDYAFDLSPEAYVECDVNSYAYLYCKENGIRNSVDISNYYKTKGVCVYCGGRFSGLFKKKCSLCGKEKDY